MPKTFNNSDCPWCTNADCQIEPATQRLMLDMKCTNPECRQHYHLFELDSCHKRSGFRIFYCQQHGVLNLFCNKCSYFVNAFLIAHDAMPSLAAVNQAVQATVQ